MSEEAIKQLNEIKDILADTLVRRTNKLELHDLDIPELADSLQEYINKYSLLKQIEELERFDQKWRAFGNVMYAPADEKNPDGSRVFYREAYPIQTYCIDGRIAELRKQLEEIK